MKNLITHVIAASTMLAGAAVSTSAMAVESVKATVNGMVCAFCAQGIEKRLSMMPATKAVFVDLKRKIVAVEAREGQKLDGKLITAEIADAGYDVTKLETVALSVEQIKAQAKAKK